MTEVIFIALLIIVSIAVSILIRHFRRLPPVPSTDPASATLRVVIPARNEQDGLGPVLDSLARLTHPAHVVVVDDHSEDDTARVARDAGVEVVTPPQPPIGWTGKAWACAVGARGDEDMVLFLDADTVLASDAVDSLLQQHRLRGGLISVQPYHCVRRFHEQFSAFFNLVAVLASAMFAPWTPRRAMAFGPCLMTSRTDYDAVGGHAAVRGAVLDDVALAAAYQRAGRAVTCFAGGSAVQMRSYPAGWAQLWSGWTKNMAAGAGATAPLAAAITVGWICLLHVVVAGTAQALVSGESVIAWAVAWAGSALFLRWLLAKVGSFAWWTWALFPLPLLWFDLVFAVSLIRTFVVRSVRWRGRAVDLHPSKAA